MSDNIPEGPAQERLNVGGDTKCKNCEQPKSAHWASSHIYCPISLGRACWYEPVDAATPAPSQPAAREWLKRNRKSFEYVVNGGDESDGDISVIGLREDLMLEAYARQQTAAKDAEIERLHMDESPELAQVKSALATEYELRQAAERERDSLRESLQRIRDLHGTDAMVRKLASDTLAGKDGQK